MHNDVKNDLDKTPPPPPPSPPLKSEINNPNRF